MQAVVAGEAGVSVDTRPATAKPPGVSRRTAIGFGLGATAGLGAGVLVTALWNQRESPSHALSGAKVTWTRGQVFRSGPNGEAVEAGAVVPSGGGLCTVGPTSSAVLVLVDGSTLCLSADTTVSVDDAGGRIVVNQGGATADLRPTAADRPPVEVGTALVALTTTGGADVDLSNGGRETEVTVQRGRVMAERDGVTTHLRNGELLTVAVDDKPAVRPTPILPDNYVLDFSERLPEGWKVGTREETPHGPELVPTPWYDPYHSARMHQIRSHQSWVRGLVRLFPDSVVSFRYRADRTGDGQVVLVSRRPKSTFKDCGCLVWEGLFLATPAGEWQTVRVRAADLLENKEGPRFAPPWVCFLLIFHSYTEDLGLRVADFRVTRPGSA